MNFSNTLIQWFNSHKRDLPWRNTQDPYKIWLSEIILQQTRVVQGLDYYKAFIQNFSNIEALSLAKEEDVLKLWQGLGYYSRARNLHATAKILHEKYSGIFPNNYKDIIELKGIGDYTACAILSFAFDLPYPVLDGNVARFITRLYGIFEPIEDQGTKKHIKSILANLIDPEFASDFSQALMEFGAIQCTPQNPSCESCPFMADCYAQNHGLCKELPNKKKKAELKNRYLHYYIIQASNSSPDKISILVHQREKKDIWQNLFELPLIEVQDQNEPVFSKDKLLENLGISRIEANEIQDEYSIQEQKSQEPKIKLLASKTQALSHQRLHISFYSIENPSSISKEIEANYQIMSLSELKNRGLPQSIYMFLKQYYPES